MIYVELEIRYSIKFKDLKEDEHEFTVWFPEVLARELVDNKVRKQMEIFINNLALLQGAEEGKFINASAGAKKNSDYYCMCDNKQDCNRCSIPGEFYDAHVCSSDSGYGFCSICGAIIHGSCADYEMHSYDPPDTL